jgi:hypothetical protein
MSDPKHSLTPWRVSGDGFGGDSLDRRRVGSNTPINVVFDWGGAGMAVTEHIAHISAGGNIEKRLENAAFIVHACNEHDNLVAQRDALLAACKNVVGNLKGAKFDPHAAWHRDIAMRVLESAIAQAKGETE